MKAILASVTCSTLLFFSIASAQEVNGSLLVNGQSAALKFAVVQEVDSATEKGFMDVIVVLSDRKLGTTEARNVERLETMARKDGLVALVVRINPDAKIMSPNRFIRPSQHLYRPPRSFAGSRLLTTRNALPAVSGPMARRTNFASNGAMTSPSPPQSRSIRRRRRCERTNR